MFVAICRHEMSLISSQGVPCAHAEQAFSSIVSPIGGGLPAMDMLRTTKPHHIY